jgi:mannose-6-phosphate isomerase-like protein (cupin superfamily)
MEATRAHLAKFDELEWDDLDSDARLPQGEVARSRRVGVGRKTMASGQCGFHVSHAKMPPGHVVHNHRHGHDEILTVCSGSIILDGPDGQVLSENDLIVIPSKQFYGFTVGPEGAEFLTIRLGPPDRIAPENDAEEQPATA